MRFTTTREATDNYVKAGNAELRTSYHGRSATLAVYIEELCQ